MRIALFSAWIACAAVCLTASASIAKAETREAYLARLKEICAVDCLQPRDFQRTARKKGARNKGDMAIIMDVAYVTREGDRYQLHNLDRESSYFDDLQLLGSAGINTSSRTGVGGLPRGRSNPTYPDLIIIEMDEATAIELLGAANAAIASPNQQPVRSKSVSDEPIVVEGDRADEKVKPSRIDFRSLMRGRRVVVRGKPRLQAVWIGARLDQRRKQVTLELSDADDLVLLPRYDEDGQPRKEDLPWFSGAAGGNDRNGE